MFTTTKTHITAALTVSYSIFSLHTDRFGKAPVQGSSGKKMPDRRENDSKISVQTSSLARVNIH